MSIDLREIIKKTGITQQEIADYLGISRQYLNNYLDETLEEPKLPQKFLDNLLFIFDCNNREELYSDTFIRTAKNVKKRMNIVRSTKESIENLFNIEHEKKIELYKIVEYFQNIAKLDQDLIESFTILLDNLTKEETYKAILSYIGKKYLLISFDDERYNSDDNKSREALLYEVFENDNLNFVNYKETYEKFVNSTKKQNDIDLDALKKSLSELGYTNISQKEVIDLLKKYNQIKSDSVKE